MSKLFLSLFLLLLVSCGSSPKIDSQSSQALPQTIKSVPKTEVSVVKSNVEASVKPITKIDSEKSTLADLNAAITNNQDDKIKAISTEILLNNSKNFNALNALAMYHYKKQQYGATKLLLNRALDVNPTSSDVYNNLALVELASDNQREAIELFKKSIELDKANLNPAINLSSIYASNKDYNKVVYSLEKIIDNKKISVGTLNNYAVALSALGKNTEAATIYEDILKNQADHKSTMLNYSILMIEKQDKFKEGLDLINRLKFVGIENESRQVIKDLEIKANAGLK